jgi:anthranilate phosphoribosyltransferase
MVVHADDGLDEVATTADTKISEWRNGRAETRTVGPEEFGLPRARLEDLLVDSPEASAATVLEVLAGRKGPARDVVILNAAAALTVAERSESIADALPIAEEAIDSGAANAALAKLVEVSNA